MRLAIFSQRHSCPCFRQVALAYDAVRFGPGTDGIQSNLYLSIASRPKAGEVVDASQPDPPRGRGARALNHTNDCLRFTKDASLLDRRLFSAGVRSMSALAAGL